MIRYDNQSCVQMLVNLVHHDQTKHVEMRYHYVLEMVQRLIVVLEYVPNAHGRASCGRAYEAARSRKVRGFSRYARDHGRCLSR